jgi:drug/metabolite transporter, DME family
LLGPLTSQRAAGGGGPARPIVEVLTAAALFGTTGTAASFAPPAATAPAIGAARLIIGGAGLLAVLPMLGGSRRAALRLWRTPLGVGAALMTALYQLCFFAGVERAGVALATLVTIGSGPVLVGLLSAAFLGERPTRGWWIATAVAVTGLALLSLDKAESPAVEMVGLLLALGAGFGYASYTVMAKRMMVAGSPPAEVMAAAFGLGGALMVPVLLITGAAWIASVPGLAVALWLGLATTTLAYVFFGRGLRLLPAGPAATLVLAEPLVAMLLGVLLLGELLGAGGWLGAAAVAIGLGLQGLLSVRAQRGERQNVVEAAVP